MKAAIPSAGRRAFTLLEVMIAVGIFAMATFAILSLVSSLLSNARRLQMPVVDAGMVAGFYSQTNQLVEGNNSGDLSDFLGAAYQGYRWTSAVSEIETNKLFQLDLVVQGPGPNHPVLSTMSILLYRPQSPAGGMDGATAPP